MGRRERGANVLFQHVDAAHLVPAPANIGVKTAETSAIRVS